MTKINLDTRIGRDSKTASRIIDSEAIVLTPLDSKIHSVNEVGTRIWELLAEKPTVEKVLSTICDEFEVDRDIAQKDINEFLNNLIDRGMVEVISE